MYFTGKQVRRTLLSGTQRQRPGCDVILLLAGVNLNREQRPSVIRPAHDILLEWVQGPRKRIRNPPPPSKPGWSSPQKLGRPSPLKSGRSPPWKPVLSSFLESHERSSTRSWTTSSPIQISAPYGHALSYRNRGFHRAGGTSSTPSTSLFGPFSAGISCSRHQRGVPPTTLGIYACRPEDLRALLAGCFSSTPRGLRTWRG